MLKLGELSSGQEMQLLKMSFHSVLIGLL
jgi:hypothetical protein